MGKGSSSTSYSESYKSIYVTISPEEYDAGMERIKRSLRRAASVDDLMIEDDIAFGSPDLAHIRRAVRRNSLDPLVLAADLVPWCDVVDGPNSIAILEKLRNAQEKQKRHESPRKRSDPNAQLKIDFYKLLNVRDPAVGCSGFNVSKVNKMMDFLPSLAKDKFLFTAFAEPVMALHMLCAMDAPLSCIKRCLSYNPDAINDVSSTIGSPLHYAAHFYASTKVIKFICSKVIDRLDAVLCQTNRAKRTPLHLACMMMHRHASDTSTELVELLTSASAQAALVVDKDGWTPLHHAVTNIRPVLAIIEDLTEVGPQAGTILTKTAEKASPLHLALRNPAVDATMVQDLVVSCPDVLLRLDAAGNTPLHVAIEARRSKREIQLMIKLGPKALHMKNQQGKIPYKLAKSLSKRDLSDDDATGMPDFHWQEIRHILRSVTAL
jgi:ankyrin repeat protein